jgi:hypothetical protein
MVRLEVDYTTTDVDGNCSCWSNYWNGIGTTTADTIDEVDETFSIANGTVSATGTIIDNNNAPTVATITLLRLLKETCGVHLLSNPSAVDYCYTFVLTNGTAGSADYTTTDVTVTVPAEQLRNGIGTNNCGYY